MPNAPHKTAPKIAGKDRDPRTRRPPPRMDDGHAFLPDPTQGEPARSPEELSETLAEEYLQSATSAEESSEDRRDEFATEEVGGPFLEATANEEFADDEDPMNPPDATKEPFPTAIRPPRGD